jgi:hypothetical protein
MHHANPEKNEKYQKYPLIFAKPATKINTENIDQS